MVAMRFPAKKNAGCPKAPCNSRQEKMAFSTPRWVVLGAHTLTSQPKFLASIGYQILLTVVLRSATFGRKGAPLILQKPSPPLENKCSETVH